jgi:hypothetical protein
MDRLVIHAVTPESARAMLAALSGFQAELLAATDGREVVVTLGRDDGEVAAVLKALERYVNERPGGPAQIKVNGHPYVMHPDAASRVNGDGRAVRALHTALEQRAGSRWEQLLDAADELVQVHEVRVGEIIDRIRLALGAEDEPNSHQAREEAQVFFSQTWPG